MSALANCNLGGANTSDWNSKGSLRQRRNPRWIGWLHRDILRSVFSMFLQCSKSLISLLSVNQSLWSFIFCTSNFLSNVKGLIVTVFSNYPSPPPQKWFTPYGNQMLNFPNFFHLVQTTWRVNIYLFKKYNLFIVMWLAFNIYSVSWVAILGPIYLGFPLDLSSERNLDWITGRIG